MAFANMLIFLTLLNPIIGSVIPVEVEVDWDAASITSQTTETLQVVSNPLLLDNSSIIHNAVHSLSMVSNDYVRFAAWYPYPRLSVPEIKPPIMTDGECKTFWDFTYADQIMANFYAGTPNVSHIISFSTIPDWMWVTNSNYTYPEDVNVIYWPYNNGTTLRDPSMKEVSDYYARLVSWYVNGGFIDECGVHHYSGHAYDIEYWEILNEIDFEHYISPTLYNGLYDAITAAIHAVSPTTKFVGLALAFPRLDYFTTFLNERNHAPGTPLDFISYHWYASPTISAMDRAAEESFAQADQFITQVNAIETVRKSLNPAVRTTLNEIGTLLPNGTTNIVPGYAIPAEYYVWSGGVYAYVVSKVTELGIEVVGESQLVGYPGQFPSVSMVDWETGRPNARLRVLELLQGNLKPGVVIVATETDNEAVLHAVGFITENQRRKVLLINKHGGDLKVSMHGLQQAKLEFVDLSTGGGPPHQQIVHGSSFTLSAYATAILMMEDNLLSDTNLKAFGCFKDCFISCGESYFAS